MYEKKQDWKLEGQPVHETGRLMCCMLADWSSPECHVIAPQATETRLFREEENGSQMFGLVNQVSRCDCQHCEVVVE